MEIVSSKWQSPSNIAIVKYWGKKGFQLPANPSISFTLDNVYTQTKVTLLPKTQSENLEVEFLFEGQAKPEFLPKILNFLSKASEAYLWIEKYKLKIESSNNFPYGTGIASSASSMSALALCLTDLDAQLSGNKLSEKGFLSKASYWSRVGSGSACRSVYGGFVLWGLTPDIEDSSDEFALELHEIHPVFTQIKDSVLIVDAGEKEVSSSKGHDMLNNHVYAATRFQQGFENTKKINEALQNGDIEKFGEIAEQEALTLHAMMLTSANGYFLIKPNTLTILDKIRAFRKETGIPVYFTLDAGPNVHLLYFDENTNQVQDWIQRDLLIHCSEKGVMHNGIGIGAVRL